MERPEAPRISPAADRPAAPPPSAPARRPPTWPSRPSTICQLYRRPRSDGARRFWRLTQFGGWAISLSLDRRMRAARRCRLKSPTIPIPNLFASGAAVSPNGVLTFTPASNANGSATITLQVEDSAAPRTAERTESHAVICDHRHPRQRPAKFRCWSKRPAHAGQSAPAVDPQLGEEHQCRPADESGQSLAFEVVGKTDHPLFMSCGGRRNRHAHLYSAADVHGYSTNTIRLKDDGGTANGEEE